MTKLELNYCTILDVLPVEPKKDGGGISKGNRKVILCLDEEDLFDMLDKLNPKNIIKYLDMRGISHREPANIIVKVKPNPNGLKLRHNLKRVNDEFRRVREEYNAELLPKKRRRRIGESNTQ